MSKNKLAKDKLLVVFLVVMGVGTLWMGFSSINSKIKGISGSNNSKEDALTDKQRSDSIIKLKTTDTDKDGISDYDELNVYHTSIYLADSDSDGFSDKEEIDSKHDPNCPKGKDCSVVNKKNNLDANKIEETILNDYLGSTENLDSQVAIDAERIFSGQATINEVKALLMAQGMTRVELDQIPDQEIMDMYSQMLKDAGYDSGSTGNQPSIDAERFLAGEATASEVKAVLATQGMSRTDLDKIPDAEIMKMYSEMLAEINK